MSIVSGVLYLLYRVKPALNCPFGHLRAVLHKMNAQWNVLTKNIVCLCLGHASHTHDLIVPLVIVVIV